MELRAWTVKERELGSASCYPSSPWSRRPSRATSASRAGHSLVVALTLAGLYLTLDNRTVKRMGPSQAGLWSRLNSTLRESPSQVVPPSHWPTSPPRPATPAAPQPHPPSTVPKGHGLV